jgi:hypothetical protein
MKRYAKSLDGLRIACEFNRSRRPYRPTTACFKTALVDLGVIESDAVAEGTAALDSGERREFLSRLRALRIRNAEVLEPGWLSEYDPRPALERVRATARQNG